MILRGLVVLCVVSQVAARWGDVHSSTGSKQVVEEEGPVGEGPGGEEANTPVCFGVACGLCLEPVDQGECPDGDALDCQTISPESAFSFIGSDCLIDASVPGPCQFDTEVGSTIACGNDTHLLNVVNSAASENLFGPNVTCDSNVTISFLSSARDFNIETLSGPDQVLSLVVPEDTNVTLDLCTANVLNGHAIFEEGAAIPNEGFNPGPLSPGQGLLGLGITNCGESQGGSTSTTFLTAGTYDVWLSTERFGDVQFLVTCGAQNDNPTQQCAEQFSPPACSGQTLSLDALPDFMLDNLQLPCIVVPQ